MKNIIITIIFIFCLAQTCLAQKVNDAKEYVLATLVTHTAADPESLTEVLNPFIKYLEEKIGSRFIIKSYNNFDLMVADFKSGLIHFGYAGNIDYVEMKKVLNISPIARHLRGGSSKYNTMLVVRKDSKFKSLADLKQKKFAYSSKDSSHGYIIPSLIIKDRFKIPLEQFFTQMVKTKKDSDSVLSVYYRKADAAYTSDLIFDYLSSLNPKLKKELKIIESSQPMVYGPLFCYPKNFNNPKDIEKIKTEVLKMGDNVKGKQILLIFKISGWEEVKDSDYDSLRKLIQKVK